MANIQIKDLVTVIPTNVDLIPISQGGNTRSATVEEIRDKALRTEVETARGTEVNLDARLDKFNTDLSDYTQHKTKLVTDTNGVHGFKIEEGTFTPYITGGTDIGTFVPIYTTQSGRYTLQNKIVYFSLKVALSSYTGLFNGTLRIAGLPFISVNDGISQPLSLCDLNYLDMDTNAKFLTSLILPNTSSIAINQYQDNGVPLSVIVANIGQTFIITISGQYKKA